MPGCSKRSLGEKLGVKPGMRVWVINAPPGYMDLLRLPAGKPRKTDGALDFIQVFSTVRRTLEEGFPRLARALGPRGMLWVSWPKKASGAETDLDENVVRRIGLASRLVDVKVCAVDAVWSALKFVRPRP
jgi:hypothetical protein